MTLDDKRKTLAAKPGGLETPRFEPTQEMRFALVLYGGVSLAIYINGVVLEFLHLVRATAPAGTPEERERDALYPDDRLASTERVYRELGQLAGNGGAGRTLG